MSDLGSKAKAGTVALGAIVLALIKGAAHCGDDAVRAGAKLVGEGTHFADDAARGASSISHAAGEAGHVAGTGSELVDDAARQVGNLAGQGSAVAEDGAKGGKSLLPSKVKAEEPSHAQRIIEDATDLARIEARRRIRDRRDEEDEKKKRKPVDTRSR